MNINCDVNGDLCIKIIQVLVFGSLGIYIAYLQHQTNKQKLLIELYDRRIKIYNYVNGLILTAVQYRYTDKNTGEIQCENLSKNLSKFYNDIYEADFLFTEDLCKEVYGIADQVNKLIVSIEDYYYLSKEAEKTENGPYTEVTDAWQKMVDIKDDLTKKRNDLKLKFSKEIKKDRFFL